MGTTGTAKPGHPPLGGAILVLIEPQWFLSETYSQWRVGVECIISISI